MRDRHYHQDRRRSGIALSNHQGETSSIVPEIVISLAPWNAAWIEVPKVACSSLKAAFAGLLDIDLASFGGDPHQAPMPALELPAVIDGALVPGVFAFAFVRNPWDRLVSCYRDKIGGEVDDFTHFTQRPGVADCLARFPAFTAGMSFAAFIEAVTGIDDQEADPHFRSQHTFVTDASGQIAIDYVGRFETLAADVEVVCRRTGIPRPVLPQLQRAAQRVDYRDYYTPRSRQLVAQRFAADLELFGYSFSRHQTWSGA